MAEIEFDDVVKRYPDGFEAVKHMNLDIAYKITPIWNVTATIRGAVHPHQVVYVGAHRDSWTYGSDDNLSGAETVVFVWMQAE